MVGNSGYGGSGECAAEGPDGAARQPFTVFETVFAAGPAAAVPQAVTR